MQPEVLVTHATRNGSTAEVARTVAEVLRERGFAVEVQPVRDVHSLEEYGAVVLAAALYVGRLHKDARQFLTAHRDALMKVPVALFVPGPVNQTEKDWSGARKQLDKELAKFPWLSPVAQHIVGGKFDPAKLGFPFNLMFKKLPVSDAQDWTKIRALASELDAMLQPVLQRSRNSVPVPNTGTCGC
jgi:menaquinone-dependent protoporphyrinogen oxidase